MSRPAKFSPEVISHAQASVSNASTLRELRKHQSVILSAVQGLDMDATAQILGISRSTVGQLQKEARNPDAPAPTPRGGRKHQYLTIEEEKEFLAPWITEATTAGILIVPPIQAALEKRLGKKVHHSQVYRMLARHGWRKVAPDSVHPKADLQAQDDWKKNSKRWYPNAVQQQGEKGPD
jgi:transposase